MKTILLQLTGRSLRLTPVKTAGKIVRFGTPASFDLPEALRGKALESVPALAAFACNRIRNHAEYAGKPVVFCLGDDSVVIKEYKHQEAKRADLLKLARLEAETVVKEDAAGYVVLTDAWRRTDPVTGKLKSVLYALPAPFLEELTQEFRKRGVRVSAVMPTISGLLSACKKPLGLTPQNPAFAGKTVAVADVGHEKLRLALFNSGTPIFQKELDSVYEDILDVLHDQGSVTREEAVQEISRPGFLLTAGRDRFGPQVAESISLLLDTAVSEAVRSLRVVLSSERLELNEILFCGAFNAHPDFNRYFDSLGLGIPYGSVELRCGSQAMGIALENGTSVAGFHTGDFFTLKGLLSAARGDRIDFLSEANSLRGNRRLALTLLILITVLSVAAMAVEPILYAGNLLRRNADRAKLQSPAYRQIELLVTSQSEKAAELKRLEADRSAFPDGKSAGQKILARVQQEMTPKVVHITQYSIDNDGGSVTLQFTAKSFSDLQAMQKSLTESGFFTVSMPFSATLDKQKGLYQCTMTLLVNSFEAYPYAQSGTASSAGEVKP